MHQFTRLHRHISNTNYQFVASEYRVYRGHAGPRRFQRPRPVAREAGATVSHGGVRGGPVRRRPVHHARLQQVRAFTATPSGHGRAHGLRLEAVITQGSTHPFKPVFNNRIHFISASGPA